MTIGRRPRANLNVAIPGLFEQLAACISAKKVVLNRENLVVAPKRRLLCGLRAMDYRVFLTWRCEYAKV